ncbi:MAG: hypothetical protein B7Y41_08385 [Hydrogenophilales bacterium 28-61-23]|nr:MAG: hypothetical protein B7Y41_08385 [Hydrogenophilales bacterium 28-61-23]
MSPKKSIHISLLCLLAGMNSVYADTAAAVADAPASDAASTASAHALDGMAPAGHWAARLTLLRNSYDRRYDDREQRVDLDAEANVSLAAFGARLDSEVTTEFVELLLGYGVTENLTLGVIVPYARTTSRLTLTEAAPGTIATVLGGLGYNKPLSTRAVSGFSDPTLGALWRFHQREHDSAVAGFGLRLGVAKADDPDDPADLPPGDGSTDLRFRLEYFRDLGGAWDLRLLGEHQVQLPDEVVMRPAGPFSSGKEKLKRDLGDYQEFDIELGKVWGDWRVSGTWHRYQEAPDRYRRMDGTALPALSANTDTVADQYRLGVTWSGVRAWRAGKLFMPLIVKLELQDAFQGRNFVDVRDIYLRVTGLF